MGIYHRREKDNHGNVSDNESIHSSTDATSEIVTTRISGPLFLYGNQYF
jgi:hypothetical protein